MYSSTYTGKTFTAMFLLAVTICGVGRAQDDNYRPLARVLEQKKLAAEAVENCDFNGARAMYNSMSKSLKDTTGSFATAGAGVTQAEIDKKLVEIDQRQKAIDRDNKKVADLLNRGQAETALSTWQAYNGQACSPEMGSKIQAARSRARELTAQGTAEPNPKQRLPILLEAFHTNNQQPGLFQELSSTRQQVAQIPCTTCRAVGKTVKTVVILGAIGGLGYVGFTQYQHWEKTHP